MCHSYCKNCADKIASVLCLAVQHRRWICARTSGVGALARPGRQHRARRGKSIQRPMEQCVRDNRALQCGYHLIHHASSECCGCVVQGRGLEGRHLAGARSSRWVFVLSSGHHGECRYPSPDFHGRRSQFGQKAPAIRFKIHCWRGRFGRGEAGAAVPLFFCRTRRGLAGAGLARPGCSVASEAAGGA